MKNLRIIDSKVTTNTVELFFNQKVSPNITSRNFTIISETLGTPDVAVLGTDVEDNKVTIDIKPLTYGSIYKVISASTHDVQFVSRDNTYLLLEDGINNKTRIQGPVDIDNPVFENFRSLFKDNIYDVDNNDAIVNKYLKGSSHELLAALNAAGQLKSDRFLSFNIIDEEKTRGRGSFDRLNNEGTYLVERVSLTPSTKDMTETVSVEFGDDVISLSQKEVNLVASVQDENFFTIFDINNLVFNLDKNLIKISSLEFTFLNANPNFTYDLDSLGYQLLESKYDDNSFTNLSLKSNQAKLSDNVLLDPLFDLSNIFRIDITYFVNNTGKSIDSESISVYDIKTAVRENIPTIVNVFDTKHAPIVDRNGDAIVLGGLTILNVESFTNTHPAFRFETKFDLSALPARSGEFSVDYERGKVYVYGDSSSDFTGTGDIPPVISYYYKHEYQAEIDYVFDDQANDQFSLNDIVALPNGSLIDSTAFVSYNFDSALTRGIDYEADIHVEVLNERVENRYKFPNVFIAKNQPLTGVFRVYNETSGEIYETQRFAGNKIFVSGNNSPTLENIKTEKVSFADSNEVLIVSDELLSNNAGTSTFKIYLKHNKIISQTEFGIGHKLNTSVVFSDNSRFVQELFFSQDIIPDLIIGQYVIDYENGIVYVASDSNVPNYNLGSIVYKFNYIETEKKHVTNVFDIAKKASIIGQPIKHYQFGEVLDSQIEVSNIDNQLTEFVNESPILYINNVLTIDGISNVFSNYQINGIYNYKDFMYSNYTYNFPYTYSNKIITVLPYVETGSAIVEMSGVDLLIETNIPINYVNSDFVYEIVATKQSDGTVVANMPQIIDDKIVLYLDVGVMDGEVINFTYTITPSNITKFVIDAIDGDIYVDYEYLADEIIISYEYGDNVLDFRESDIDVGTTYYVSYKAGALREGLNNFATLLKIPELQVFDSNYERESFRDALQGGLSSFLLGSTNQGITNIVNSISHIDPEIKETLFEQWILGDSFLHSDSLDLNASEKVETKYELAPKFTNNDYLNIPFSSNINLEEGTFSTWFKNGTDILENSADLTFLITLDGYEIDNRLVFIGAQEYHPNDIGAFVINKNNIVEGVPEFNKEGIFIYLETIGNIPKWKVFVSGITDADAIKISVTSSQKIYATTKESGFYSSDRLVTKQKGFILTVDLSSDNDRVVSFISGEDKYIFDSNDENKNRMSLFFNAFGYLTFRIFDDKGKSATVSANCGSWKAEDLHHIGVGWKINTANRADEIHLFIDGQEVSDLNYWGENYESMLEGSFSSKHLDRYIGSFNKDIIGSTDLVTNSGSFDVTSSVNFSDYSISPGDIIYINEPGFDPGGYSIASVAGQTLTLTVAAPQTFSNARFSVNRASLTLNTKDWLYPNLAVLKAEEKLTTFGHVSGKELICISDDYLQMNVGDFLSVYNVTSVINKIDEHNITVNHDMGTYSNVPFVIHSPEFSELRGENSNNPEYFVNDNLVTVTSGVRTGDLLFVSTLGVNSERFRATYYSWSDGYENVLKTRMPTPIDLDTVSIKHQIMNEGITSNNATSIGEHFTYTKNIDGYELSPSDIGRFLNVKVSGGHINTALSVIINGETLSGLTSEELIFTDYSTQQTINQFLRVFSVDVDGYATAGNRTFCAIEIFENNITIPESSSLFPELKYNYPIKDGFALTSDGYTNQISDADLFFSYSDLGNVIWITSPVEVGGVYQITNVIDNHTVETDGYFLPFTNGSFQILRNTSAKTGFQNGYFTFQQSILPGYKYFLPKGNFIVDFASKLYLDYKITNDTLIIGNSFDKQNPLNGSLDQIKIENVLLEDVRIGEISSNKNITSEFNALKPQKPTSSTMFLLQGNKNVANYYDRNKNKNLFYTNHHINSNFGDSIHVLKPLQIDNDGIFNTNEGTISFWISPIADGFHENRVNTIFDFYGAITEEIDSIDRNKIVLNNSASHILKVELLNKPDKDYFEGGNISVALDDTILEEVSLVSGQSQLTLSRPIQQVVAIKKKNIGASYDLGLDFYGQAGSIGTDSQTVYLGVIPSQNGDFIVTYKPLGINAILNKQVINLGAPLPSDVMKTRVTYMPTNMVGDRMSLFKDKSGLLNFVVKAGSNSSSIITPVDWVSGSWHKIKISYSMKNSITDTISMWVDGYQVSNDFTNDTNFLHSSYDGYNELSFGNVVNYNNNNMKLLNFTDQIQTLTFGSFADFTAKKNFVMDDLKFTNHYDDGYSFSGERVDLSYSSNLDTVVPAASDLYTTFILSGNSERILTDNFSTLRNKGSNNNDFYLNIFDSFDIIKNNDRVKLILEKLIKLMKPASSKVYIRYIG